MRSYKSSFQISWPFYSGNQNLQYYLIAKVFWSQSPPNSTGRDKCNTIQKHSIATDPNLCRKGFDFPSLFLQTFHHHSQFCMDLHSRISHSWMQTCKTNHRTVFNNRTEQDRTVWLGDWPKLEFYSEQYFKCS